MKKFTVAGCILCLSFQLAAVEGGNALTPVGTPGQPMTLSENGMTDYRIVIPGAATTMEEKAADDLALWLHEMTGATFPIVADNTAPQSKEISVGRTRRVPDAMRAGDLGPDGIAIGQDGQRLLIQGGTRRGIINAVYALLEEDLGCRWYAENAPPHIPSRPTLTFSPVLRSYVPALRYRDPFYTVAFDVDWAIRNRTTPGIPIHASKDDRTFVRIPAEWGGSMYWAGRWVHTVPVEFLPPEKYVEQHPEWYRVNADGVRDTWQMAETHPEAMKEVVKNAVARMDEHPYANLVSVSKNDGNDWTSESDRWLTEKEGADVAPMLRLANLVAETLEKTHPHVTVTTLAYLGALEPPRTIRPRGNVAIRLCNDRTWGHPLLPAREDDVYREITEKWSAIAPKLYIWDYVVDFGNYTVPMPNFHVIADNIRFHVENKAEGIMLQANYQGRSGGREHMKAWVSAKLLWNPDLDLDELIEDFTYGFYGKAAPHVMDYNRMMRRFGEANRNKHGILNRDPNLDVFTKEWMAEAEGYLEKAEAAAEDNDIRLRVQTVRMGPMYVKLTRGPEWTGMDEYPALIDHFVSIAERAGVNSLCECPIDFDGFVARWRTSVNKFAPKVRDGRLNLAQLPDAKAAASSVYADGKEDIHQTAHLNNGIFGNRQSWIAGAMPAWVEIDLGAAYPISEVRLGNDQTGEYADRAATAFRILAATDYAPDSRADTWRPLTEYNRRSGPLGGQVTNTFEPVTARWVRVELLESSGGLPRIDEIEIYEHDETL